MAKKSTAVTTSPSSGHIQTMTSGCVSMMMMVIIFTYSALGHEIIIVGNSFIFQLTSFRRQTWIHFLVWQTVRLVVVTQNLATFYSTRGWTRKSASKKAPLKSPKPKTIKNIDKCSLINSNYFHVFHSVSTAITKWLKPCDAVKLSPVFFDGFIGFGGSGF